MNTLELNFATWFYGHDYNFDSAYKASDMQAAFNAGYLAGFNHAKKEALSTLATALDPRPRND